MLICVGRSLCDPGEDCGGTRSTNVAARPTLSAVWTPKAGRHFTKATPDRSPPEFADSLLEVAEHYPVADTIHLVMDNLSSHSRKAVVEQYGEKAGGWLWDRFTVHYTPTHGS